MPTSKKMRVSDREMHAAQEIVDRFNRRFPIGTVFHYFPIIGETAFEPRRTRSRAFVTDAAEPAVHLEGHWGVFSLVHLHVLTFQSVVDVGD